MSGNLSGSESYKKAGVDVTAGYQAVDLIKKHVARTVIPGVESELGGFGGLFAPDLSGIKQPVLVAGTDGVGTKLKIAFLMDKHDTIGQDCVAMCVNDIVCSGAKPLFFLDYLAVGKNIPTRVEAIVKGVADGCVEAGCALIGGETAEMPGFYPADEYDLAGFSVGIADREKLVQCIRIQSGDVLIGLASSGVHSNGFSLVRKVLNISSNNIGTYVEDLAASFGEVLLTPTRIYVRAILDLLNRFEIKGISHITGGGFYENIPRMLPKGLSAVIHLGSFPVLPVFHLIERSGKIPTRDMYNTFNMGIGMVIAVSSEKADEVCRHLNKAGEQAYIIGVVTAGDGGITLC